MAAELIKPGVSRRTLLRGTMGALGAATFAGSAATLLGGCSGDDEGGDLTFWNFYGPADDDNPQSQWFVSLVDEWNKNNDVQVKLRYLPPAQYFAGQALQTAFQSDDGPDIFMVSPGDFLRYYNGGVLQDLTSTLGGVKDDFVPGALDTRMVDDKVYGLPMEIEPLAMYYSIDAFEQQKLSEGDIPKTWDQLLDVADKLTTSDRFGLLLDTVPGYYQNFTWYPFLWMGGGNVIENDASTFDSDATVAALQLWQDTINQDVAIRKPAGDGATDIGANLAADAVGMQQSGIWSVFDMQDEHKDYPYGVFRLPVSDGGTYATGMGGWSFVANAKGKDPDTAAKFVTWALGSDESDGVERCRQWNTVVKSNLPTRSSVQKSAEKHGAFDTDTMRTFVDDIVPGGRAEPRYTPEVYQPVSDAIQACQLDGADPAEEAAAASETIDAFLDTYDGAPLI